MGFCGPRPSPWAIPCRGISNHIVVIMLCRPLQHMKITALMHRILTTPVPKINCVCLLYDNFRLNHKSLISVLEPKSWVLVLVIEGQVLVLVIALSVLVLVLEPWVLVNIPAFNQKYGCFGERLCELPRIGPETWTRHYSWRDVPLQKEWYGVRHVGRI